MPGDKRGKREYELTQTALYRAADDVITDWQCGRLAVSTALDRLRDELCRIVESAEVPR